LKEKGEDGEKEKERRSWIWEKGGTRCLRKEDLNWGKKTAAKTRDPSFLKK